MKFPILRTRSGMKNIPLSSFYASKWMTVISRNFSPHWALRSFNIHGCRSSHSPRQVLNKNDPFSLRETPLKVEIMNEDTRQRKTLQDGNDFLLLLVLFVAGLDIRIDSLPLLSFGLSNFLSNLFGTCFGLANVERNVWTEFRFLLFLMQINKHRICVGNCVWESR